MARFEQVYREYAAPVYRFLLTLSGDRDQAEELLQETFYRALQHIDRFQGRCSLYTWLCQIGKNAWLRERRRLGRLSGPPGAELVSPAPSPEEQALDRDSLERIRAALDRLEEPYKEVFILHVLGGVRLREIATLRGKSESWARVTYFRAKEKIAGEVLP